MPKQVLFLMTDTQRYDMIGCARGYDVHTPNLDALAGEGLRFDAAYTCQPVCGPARAALFTGTYPHSNGSWTNSYAIGDNVKTLGQRLTDQGVHAAYIGKYHLDGGDYFGLGRCPEGWDADYWYDMRCFLEELTEDERRASRRGENLYQPGGYPRQMTFGHRCSNRAIDFLEKHAGEDYCLVVSYDEPHEPHMCPEPYAGMFRERCPLPDFENLADPLTDKPEHHRVWAGRAMEEDRSGYSLQGRRDVSELLGVNAFVDDEIGRVLAAAQRYAPDAMIVYTSDHGTMLGSHRMTGKGPNAYEEIARIPLIVKAPGITPAGAVARQPASHIDLAPTILDYFGLAAPPPLEGRSLLPELARPEAAPSRPVFVEFGRYEVDHDGFGGYQPLRAVFDGRYKLVINLMTSDELYDLETDPGELTNRIADPGLRAVRDGLHDQLLAWMNDTRDPFRGYYWERRPWRTDAHPATWSYTAMTRQRENETYEPRQLDYDTGMPMERAVRPKGSPYEV